MVKFWWSANYAGPTSFTDTSWTEKLTCDFTTSEVGDYLIIVSGEMMNTGNYTVGMQAQLDDSASPYVGISLIYANTNIYHPFSAIYLAESLSVGAHYVDVDCRVSGGTGVYRNVHIAILRLDDVLPTTGMYDYVATESDSTITGSWATYQTLTFTPDEAGDYLILGHCRLYMPTPSYPINFRMNYDSGSEYLPVLANSLYGAKEARTNGDSYNLYWGGIVSLPASEKTIIMEAQTSGTSYTIDCRRIIAIRLSALNVESTEDASETSTQETSWYDKSVLTFTPNATGYYLLLASQFNGSSAVSRYNYNRFVQTAGTGAGTIQENVFQSKDITDRFASSSCYIKSLGATSQTFKTQYHDQNGSQYVYSKGSFIAAIRLEDRWWNASKDTEFSFTNTSYAEKFTMEFNVPVSGDYLVIVSCQAGINTFNYNVYTRAQLDDSVTLMETQFQPYTAYAACYMNCGTVYLAESLSAGAHYIDLDAYVELGSSATGYLQYVKIVVVRLDDWLPTTGMYDYVATEAETGSSGSWNTVQTLTFTPDQAGDYLILGSCECSPRSSTSNLNVRLNYDSASEYLPLNNSEESGNNYLGTVLQGDTNDYFSRVWGGIISLPASEKTILMESYSGIGSSAYVRKRRIIAIRLDALDSSFESDEDTDVSSTSSQWVDKSEVSFSPSSGREYLIIGGMVLKPDGIINSASARLEQTAGTDTGTFGQTNFRARDASDPADIVSLMAAHIKYLAASTQTFKTQYGYYSGSGTQYGKGSFIVAIRKPTAEVEAFKDIPLKVSIESALTYKDVPLKLSIDIGPAFKDVLLKTSIESEFIFKDIPLKISISSAGFTITGITYDKSGNPLGNCKCYLFKDNLDNTLSFIAFTTSNPSTGVYSFIDIADDDAQYLVVAWKDDSPHVFDVTDHVLQPS